MSNNPTTPPDDIQTTTTTQQQQSVIYPSAVPTSVTLQQHQFTSHHDKPSLAISDWQQHQTAFMNSIATPTASPLELPSSAATRFRMGSANPPPASSNLAANPAFVGRSHSLDHGSTASALLNLQPLNYAVAGVGVGGGAVHSWTGHSLLQNFQSPNVFNNLGSSNGDAATSLIRGGDDGMSHGSLSDGLYTSFNAPAQSMQWNSMSELSPTTWNPINTFPTFSSPHVSHGLLNSYSFQDHRQQQPQQQHLQFQQLQQQQQQLQQQPHQSLQFSNIHRNSISTSWGSDPLSILTHQTQTHDPGLNNTNNFVSSEPQQIITTCSPLQFSSIVSGGSPPTHYSSTTMNTASPHSLQQQPLSAIETVYIEQELEEPLVHSIPLQLSPSVSDKLSPKSAVSGREVLGRRARRTVAAKRDVDKDREKLDVSDDEDESVSEDEEEDSETASDREVSAKRSAAKKGGRKQTPSTSSGSSYKNNKRFRIPKDQMVWLKKVFSETPLPSTERMAEIAGEVDVDVHKIKIW
ncbi:hypothetical protein HDU81_004539 [Chytriomyces hyalinus]|nr:hypothetical protein HDU81_004539 [Chytriomyces hyalinus]